MLPGQCKAPRPERQVFGVLAHAAAPTVTCGPKAGASLSSQLHPMTHAKCSIVLVIAVCCYSLERPGFYEIG
jgi:hypothetical protein